MKCYNLYKEIDKKREAIAYWRERGFRLFNVY